jgi:hypothetical protein
MTVSAPQNSWSCGYPLRLVADTACRADESMWPPDFFKTGGAFGFARKHPLELKERLRLMDFHDGKNYM